MSCDKYTETVWNIYIHKSTCEIKNMCEDLQKKRLLSMNVKNSISYSKSIFNKH